jgi:DNA ligase-1
MLAARRFLMKPMLAVQCEIAQLRYPLYASPKLDGVRGVVIDGVLHSRSLKKFPNAFVAERFSKPEYSGLDGELILGDPCAKDVFRVTSGACQRHDGTPDVKFYVFDYWHRVLGFKKSWVEQAKHSIEDDPNIVILPQHYVLCEEDLLILETKYLDEGYEGLILRDPDGLYKFGRSTLKEGWMLKLKRFTDGEAEILEVIEEMENTNEKKTNELGRGKRSSHKEGMVPKGTTGAFRVRDLVSDVVFDIGTGLTDIDSQYFWKNRAHMIGKIIKYKSFAVGVKDKPRFPTFMGLREKWDMS